ncbi:unnamed protein product [marine sediment metagenome]|uniref:Uncharacterized protein n=1 Tax=marine sediment metagenome TaxID=412755 RepID=X1JIN7_9ZZZZ
MTHSYYPDGYSSAWSMNSLNMYNSFPTKTINEAWSGWNLNYASQVTTSSFSNGDLTSNLNLGALTPNQPDDFNLTKGSFTQYGDLESIDASYSIINSTESVFQTDEFIDSITYTKGSSGASGEAIKSFSKS